MGNFETAPLDEAQISARSRDFARQLFTRFPDFRRHAEMERLLGAELWELAVTVPAASGKAEVFLFVWVEDGATGEPSVSLVRWHTHASVWQAEDKGSLLELIEGILADRYVICAQVGVPSYVPPRLLDLAEEDALMEFMTRPHTADSAIVYSWSGRLDRTLTLRDFE